MLFVRVGSSMSTGVMITRLGERVGATRVGCEAPWDGEYEHFIVQFIPL